MLVIPTYNERANVNTLVSRVRAAVHRSRSFLLTTIRRTVQPKQSPQLRKPTQMYT